MRRAAQPGADNRGVLWPALVLTLAPLYVRAASSIVLLPGWDTDPFSSSILRSGLSPAGSMVCDVVSLIGSALLMLFVRGRALPISVIALTLSSIGFIAVLAHAFILGPEGARGSIANQRIGLAWLSGMAGAVALFHAARDDCARRVVVASFLGFVVLLTLRGAHELLIDHPRTVADYLVDKPRILASHGWPPGSSMARAFERRLMQTDVSGWFGLANVYGAVCAAGAILFGGIVALTWHARPKGNSPTRAALVIGALGFLAAAAGVAMSQSKGAILAASVGLALLFVFGWLRMRATRSAASTTSVFGGLLGAGAIAGALLLIVLRGLVGERVGELSILFRWFYIQASLRIFGANPFLGVGPDGFQSAYTLAKNPISPEEVTSPHSVLFDWLATLGAFGIPWCVLLVWWAWRTGHVAVSGITTISAGSRNETRAVLAIAALSTLAASYLQGLIVTPDIALLRAVGLLVWCAGAWGALSLLRNSLSTPVVLAAAVIALVAHAQIDVDLTWTQSCGILLALIAVAAAPDAPFTAATNPRRSRLFSLISTAILAVLAMVSVPLAIIPAIRWERALWTGADIVRPVADIRRRLDDLSRARTEGLPTSDSIERIVADLTRAVGRSVRPSNDDIGRALAELDAAFSAAAAPHLLRADALDPSDSTSRREASRLWVRHADAARMLGRSADVAPALDRAVATLEMPGRELAPNLLANLAQVRLHRADMLGDPSDITLAAAALERAMTKDPYNLDLARQRYRIASRLQDRASIRTWAAKCLELDSLMRLDRDVRGLAPDERTAMQQAANPSSDDHGAP